MSGGRQLVERCISSKICLDDMDLQQLAYCWQLGEEVASLKQNVVAGGGTSLWQMTVTAGTGKGSWQTTNTAKVGIQQRDTFFQLRIQCMRKLRSFTLIFIPYKLPLILYCTNLEDTNICMKTIQWHKLWYNFPVVIRASCFLQRGQSSRIATISKQLYAVPYPVVQPWLLLQEESIPSVHCASQLAIHMCITLTLRPMTMVFGLGMRLCMRMHTKMASQPTGSSSSVL